MVFTPQSSNHKVSHKRFPRVFIILPKSTRQPMEKSVPFCSSDCISVFLLAPCFNSSAWHNAWHTIWLKNIVEWMDEILPSLLYWQTLLRCIRKSKSKAPGFYLQYSIHGRIFSECVVSSTRDTNIYSYLTRLLWGSNQTKLHESSLKINKYHPDTRYYYSDIAYLYQ